MSASLVNIIKTPFLDGVEIKSATFINKTFPVHFHLDWSLAFIKSGSEHILAGDHQFLLCKNAVILIPPHSIHANWGIKDTPWTYEAIYLNSDVVKHIAKKCKMDYAFLAEQPYYIDYLNTIFTPTETNISQLIRHLFDQYKASTQSAISTSKNSGLMADILAFLSTCFDAKVTLAELEQKFKINRYKLLRQFKAQIGLSPLEYQMAMRIENAKKLVYSPTPLVQVALETGFYDQSHFSHCFKKYVGLTPKKYQIQCNILQE